MSRYLHVASKLLQHNFHIKQVSFQLSYGRLKEARLCSEFFRTDRNDVRPHTKIENKSR